MGGGGGEGGEGLLADGLEVEGGEALGFGDMLDEELLAVAAAQHYDHASRWACGVWSVRCGVWGVGCVWCGVRA